MAEHFAPTGSQQPGQRPINKTWESAQRWFPKAEHLYPLGRLRNPDGKLGTYRR